MSAEERSQDRVFDTIVVGAGASGIGVGIVLQKMGINYVMLEKSSVGASFKKWPKETRFISPSFTGNFFNMPDLNAISPDTSPAFSLLTEHPHGQEYAEYLETASEHFELNVQTGVEVEALHKEAESFIITTNTGTYTCRFLIWAAGEFQYPRQAAFTGDVLCTHYASIASFSDMQGEDRIVIGAYESGFDAAVNLVREGKKVTLLDSSNNMETVSSDSSYSLSPFTRDRIREQSDGIEYHVDTRVESVAFENGMYVVTDENDVQFYSKYEPVNCTGFDSSLSLVRDMFDFTGSHPILNSADESSKTRNLFLVGPQVKHGNALFCFIYKFRQRFVIVAEQIAQRSHGSHDRIERVVQEYKDGNFFLQDLSSCDDECAC